MKVKHFIWEQFDQEKIQIWVLHFSFWIFCLSILWGFGSYPCLCLPVLVVCLNAVPNKGLCCVLIESCRKCGVGKEWGIFMEIFSVVLQRTKLLPDPNCSRTANRHYQAVSIYLYIVSNTYGEYLLYMVVPELLVAFSRLLQHTQTQYPGSGAWKGEHTLWLKICKVLSCKIWLHGKSVGREVDFIVLKV